MRRLAAVGLLAGLAAAWLRRRVAEEPAAARVVVAGVDGATRRLAAGDPERDALLEIAGEVLA